MNARENYLRAAEFRHPASIPCTVWFIPATWKRYGSALESMTKHFPRLFGVPSQLTAEEQAAYGPKYREGETFTDSWGCVWYNAQGGLMGQVVGNPLEDWRKLAQYKPPDPLTESDVGPQDWDRAQEGLARAKALGYRATGHLPHDFLFQRLYDLRGFENFMMDLIDDPPELHILIEMIVDHHSQLIRKWISLGADVIYFGDDLGSQKDLVISPQHFRKYIKPAYSEMFSICKAAGVHVYLHSDGHILGIVDDLIECGVTILNPGIVENTLEGLVRGCKGKIALDAFLSTQTLPFVTPDRVKEEAREAARRLSSANGGLMMNGECAPDVPLDNMVAMCEVLEEIRSHPPGFWAEQSLASSST